MLDKRLAEYLRGMISNEEVIKELLEMAKLMKQHAEEGNALGLSDEEQAFYDALTRPSRRQGFLRERPIGCHGKRELQTHSEKTVLWIGDKRKQRALKCER